MENVTLVKAHLPCSNCGSSDALSIYSDGHTYCFSCNTHTQNAEDNPSVLNTNTNINYSNERIFIIHQEVEPLPKRGITESTCERYQYYKGKYNGRHCQIANYYNPVTGELEGQKLRFPDKTFLALGKVGDFFYGQHLFNGGDRLVITEGEIDCLSVSQLEGNIENVVSIPTGASGARRVFEKNLDWLNKFDEVVVMFDNDEAGQKAVENIRGILPIGKLKVAILTQYKDANEYLIHNKGALLRDCIEQAQSDKPDGIINGASLWEELKEEPPTAKGYDLKWDIEANSMIQGLRKGEMVVVTAGTGVGKSTFIREIMYDLAMRHKLKVGIMMLEENVRRTAQGIMSIHAKKRLHISRAGITDEEYKRIFDETLGNKRFFLYNHFGSLEGNNLLNTIRYLAIAEKVDFIMLDHISIAVSGIATGNERKMIDILMTKLRSICEETGVGLVVVSHLKRVDNAQTSHEEGGKVSLSDLRGSQALSQLPDTVIALERNQQDIDEQQKNDMRVRILKCRFTGETGLGGMLHYDKDTNRLIEIDTQERQEENLKELEF